MVWSDILFRTCELLQGLRPTYAPFDVFYHASKLTLEPALGRITTAVCTLLSSRDLSVKSAHIFRRKPGLAPHPVRIPTDRTWAVVAVRGSLQYQPGESIAEAGLLTGLAGQDLVLTGDTFVVLMFERYEI